MPPHLRDAHYAGVEEARPRARATATPTTSRYGIAEQQYAPDVVADATYYRPTSLGAEAALKERWERVRRMIRGQRG